MVILGKTSITELNILNPLSIENGGTGATTADGALTNLGVKSYVKSLSTSGSAIKYTLGNNTSQTLPTVQGTQGSQGSQGVTGTQGVQGSQGFTGTQGTQGVQGSQGFRGTQGSVGTTSTTQGPRGAQGVQGSQGTANTTQGSQGSQGTQGSAGISAPYSLSGEINHLTYYTSQEGDYITITVKASHHCMNIVTLIIDTDVPQIIIDFQNQLAYDNNYNYCYILYIFNWTVTPCTVIREASGVDMRVQYTSTDIQPNHVCCFVHHNGADYANTSEITNLYDNINVGY